MRHNNQEMDQSTENELLNKSRNGDLAALETVYDRYSPGLYRYAWRLLGNEHLAEDCVSETFSRFLKGLRSGQGPDDHLQAYLYRIAHNWITDCYRRQAPEPVELNENFPAGEREQTENQALLRMEKQKVRLALRGLTSDQRQVITLRFIECWNYEEIARAIEKPLGAVRALQFRGLTSLRRMLLEESDHE